MSSWKDFEKGIENERNTALDFLASIQHENDMINIVHKFHQRI
jgi:hypothetical protein